MVKNNRDTKLVQKASEVIGENTTWVNLADQLKVDSYRYRDGYPEWHTSTPFRPMFLSYLWAIVEGQSLTGIPHRLEELPELARAFGFDPEDLPSESSFKPVRLERRFENLERVVKKEADQIRTIAAERGAPIGFDLGIQ